MLDAFMNTSTVIPQSWQPSEIDNLSILVLCNLDFGDVFCNPKYNQYQGIAIVYSKVRFFCMYSTFLHQHQLKTSIFQPPTSTNSIPEDKNIKFRSSFARCLNLPPCAMDQKTWLENELLDTRQVRGIHKPKSE